MTHHGGNIKFNIKSQWNKLPRYCFIMCCDSCSAVVKELGVITVVFALTRQFKELFEFQSVAPQAEGHFYLKHSACLINYTG